MSLGACEGGSGVEWSAPRPLPPGDGALVVDASAHVARGAVLAAPASWPAAPMCPGSARAAWLDARHVYAVWWAARPDSSAALWAAASADSGATWRAPVVVDTLDRSSDGCLRAAPSIAASGDYVHVVYGLRAPEGAGVFFSHSMDRGGMFHAPVIIVYGDRPAAAAVAARGDTVVVAYEDPNVTPPAIAIAISRSMGHMFEQRSVVAEGVTTVDSLAVALRGRALAVGWGNLVRAGTLR